MKVIATKCHFDYRAVVTTTFQWSQSNNRAPTTRVLPDIPDWPVF